MNTETINSVVDKLAEKLQIAADQVKPVAEETISQVQTYGLTMSILTGIGMLLLIAVTYYGATKVIHYAHYVSDYDKENTAIAQIVIWAVISIVAVFMIIRWIFTLQSSIQQATAPLAHTLGVL